MSNSYADRTHCKYNHEYTVENTSFRKDGGRACRACRKDRPKRELTPRQLEEKREKDRKRANERRSNWSPERRAEFRLKDKIYRSGRAKMKSDVEDSLAKKNQLDYLKLNDDQARRSDDLNFAIDRSGSKPQCESDPDLWSFDVDAPPSSWPTAQEAQEMCEGCPFLEECLAFADSQRTKVVTGVDASGVMGGVRFRYGKRLN